MRLLWRQLTIPPRPQKNTVWSVALSLGPRLKRCQTREKSPHPQDAQLQSSIWLQVELQARCPGLANHFRENPPPKSVTRRLLMTEDLDTPRLPNNPIDHIASLPGASNQAPEGDSLAGPSSLHYTPPMHDSSPLSTTYSGSEVTLHPRTSSMVAETRRLEHLWQLEKQQKDAEKKSNDSMRAIISIKERDIEDQQRQHVVREDTHRLEVLAFENELKLLRIEMKETNDRIQLDAKTTKLAVAKKDEELHSLYKHTSWQEEATVKQIQEFQDKAQESRQEKQVLTSQLDQYKKETAILARMNKHLSGEKDTLVEDAKRSAYELSAQHDLREMILAEQNDEFQLEKSVMTIEYQDTIDQTEAALCTQNELRQDQLQSMFDTHKQQESILVTRFQEQINQLKSDLTIAKAYRPTHALATAGAGGDGDSVPSSSPSTPPPAYHTRNSSKRDSMADLSTSPVRKRRNTNEYFQDMLAVMPASGKYQDHKRSGMDKVSPTNPNIRNRTDSHYGFPAGPVDTRDEYHRRAHQQHFMGDTQDHIRLPQATHSQDMRQPPNDPGNQQHLPAAPHPDMAYRDIQHRYQESSTSLGPTPTVHQATTCIPNIPPRQQPPSAIDYQHMQPTSAFQPIANIPSQHLQSISRGGNPIPQFSTAYPTPPNLPGSSQHQLDYVMYDQQMPYPSNLAGNVPGTQIMASSHMQQLGSGAPPPPPQGSLAPATLQQQQQIAPPSPSSSSSLPATARRTP